MTAHFRAGVVSSFSRYKLIPTGMAEPISVTDIRIIDSGGIEYIRVCLIEWLATIRQRSGTRNVASAQESSTLVCGANSSLFSNENSLIAQSISLIFSVGNSAGSG